MAWNDELASSCSDSGVATNVVSALTALLQRDAHLFRVNVNERAIAHRLAVYLEHEFPKLNTDCEYNRDGHDPKEIAPGSGDDGEHGSRVYPDIIVHKRGTANNFLVVELKKSSNPQSDARDLEKLHGYCSLLGYEHGLFVRLRVGGELAEIERALFVY